jgi:hypothetical protein
VIAHVIGACLLGGALVWGIVYVLRWNRSDEAWLHGHGYCTGRFASCEGHMETLVPVRRKDGSRP